MRYLNRSQNRFSNYRELIARYASTGACGHSIKAGDTIGWHQKHGARCADCWSRWCSENAEADLLEAASGYQSAPDFDGGW